DHEIKAEQYACVIPGEVEAPAFGCHIRLDWAAPARDEQSSKGASARAVVRSWKPGDRVHLRYSSGLRKVKEVLERMKVTGEDRIHWPVVEVDGRVVWMRGVELDPDPSVRVSVEPVASGGG